MHERNLWGSVPQNKVKNHFLLHTPTYYLLYILVRCDIMWHSLRGLISSNVRWVNTKSDSRQSSLCICYQSVSVKQFDSNILIVFDTKILNRVECAVMLESNICLFTFFECLWWELFIIISRSKIMCNNRYFLGKIVWVYSSESPCTSIYFYING